MKKLAAFTVFLSSFFFFSGCKKDNYPGAQISPYIAILDIRDLYKGQALSLTTEKMFGSDKITGVVVSDHSGKNLPDGLLVIQDRRRLSELRGISLNIGSSAVDYLPGDSVVVNVQGGVLKRENGVLQITGLTNANITKVRPAKRHLSRYF